MGGIAAGTILIEDLSDMTVGGLTGLVVAIVV